MAITAVVRNSKSDGLNRPIGKVLAQARMHIVIEFRLPVGLLQQSSAHGWD